MCTTQRNIQGYRVCLLDIRNSVSNCCKKEFISVHSFVSCGSPRQISFCFGSLLINHILSAESNESFQEFIFCMSSFLLLPLCTHKQATDGLVIMSSKVINPWHGG